jgi:hypothetical protein
LCWYLYSASSKLENMPIDFDAHIRLADLRVRAAAGETISAAEMRDLLLDLQRGREASATRAAAEKRTAAKAKPQTKLDLKQLFTASVASIEKEDNHG